jgi:alpha-ribazole phosphatase/probable phosphoglycerate mutase
MQTDDGFRWPGGESYACFRRRVLRVVHAIARRHVNEQVVLVTHAGVVNQILGWMHGQNAARWENFRPGNASITTIIREGSSWHLESFDDRI